MDFILSTEIPSFITRCLGVVNAVDVISSPSEFFSPYLCVSALKMKTG